MKINLFFAVLFLTLACNKTKTCEDIACQIELAKSDAVAMHNDVMKGMGEMRSVKKLLLKADSSASPEKHLEFELLIGQLDTADKGMWNWMHNFNASYQAENDSLVLEYFQKQLESIKQVKLDIDSAIVQGRRFVP